MKLELHSIAQPSKGQRHFWRVLCMLGLFLSTLLPINWVATSASAQTETYWLGRLTGTEYVFDTQLPADFAAMITANGSKYAAFKDLPKLTNQLIAGKSYSFVSISLAWDKNLIDNGQIAFQRNGAIGANSWFTMDKSSAEWQALTSQLKAQATVKGTWKYVDLLVLISPNAETPTVRMSIFGAQERYWLGRVDGTEYLFDTPLPPNFVEKILAADPNKYVMDKSPREFPPQTVNGTQYSFVKTQITYDKPQFEKGEVALVRKAGTTNMLWVNGQMSSAVGKPLAAQLPTPKQGEWKSLDVVILISPNAETPKLRLPVPQTTLAKLKMSELGQKTQAGLYYPAVKIPANLDDFRAQMLAYGNAGRQDANFRKDNGSQTVTDLSLDTVRTDVYKNGKKTGQTQMEQVFRQSETPPFFADHVLNDKLNQAAQFQAEYQASINKLGHDGPQSYRDPKTGKNVNLFDLGQRADFFGVASVVEAAGQGGLGDYPHSWMAGETHFRPWFNVTGCYPQIGYGAAMAANGTWYFVAVPEIDTNCVNPGPAAQPKPADASTSAPTSPAASTGTAQENSFPLLADHAIVRGQKYPSASGNHYLIFQPDGNVVVYTAAGQYVWGLQSVTPNYSKAQSVQMQKDGNLVVRGANDAYIWSALTQNPDASAYLTLTPDGVLLLVSGNTSAILWASNGDLTQALPPAETSSAAQQTNKPTAPANAGASTANTDALTLEIGKEYVIRETDGSSRYFRLTSNVRGTYHFELCPYANTLGSMETTGTTNVMSVEAAQAQNITPTNETCTWGEQNRVLSPEVGKQYIILEANNSARYFKVTSQRGDSYNYELCPDGRGTMSATRPTNVMRIDLALAQNISPTNQPCDANKVPYGN